MGLEQLILHYGIEVMFIAIIAIILIGVVKILFKRKLENTAKQKKKVLYQMLGIVFTVLLVSLFNTIPIAWGIAFDFKIYTAKLITSYAAMKVIYPIYENYGLRELFKELIELFRIKESEEKEE